MAYGSKKVVIPPLGWELIKTGTFSNDINITGLAGDSDKLWQLIIRARSTDPLAPALRFNGDAGANYNYINHFAAVKSAAPYHDYNAVAGATKLILSYVCCLNHLWDLIISPVSGQKRIVTGHGAEETDANMFGTNTYTGVWLNTANNITTINILTGPIIAGEYWLFRRKS